MPSLDDTRLESSSLILRPVDVTDATPTYVGWMNSPQVNAQLETRHSSQTLESVRSYIINTRKNPRAVFLAMVLKQTNEHIGNMKLELSQPTHGRGEISLWIGPSELWGRGLASEAIGLLSSWAFERLGLRKLTAGCYSTNIGSARAFEKAGFIREAVLRQHYVLDDRFVDRWCYARFAPRESERAR